MKKILGLFVMLGLVLGFTFAKQSLVSNNGTIDVSSTNLTGVYTGGDIVISAASFVQTLPDGTVGPVNTILSTGSDAPVTVTLTFKNIGTMPLYISNSNSKKIFLYYNVYGYSGNGGYATGKEILLNSNSLTQGNYLLPGGTIQGTMIINSEMFNVSSASHVWFFIPSNNNILSYPDQFYEYGNDVNNGFSIYYKKRSPVGQLGDTCGARTRVVCDKGLVCQGSGLAYDQPGTCQLENTNSGSTFKGFDLTIQDITSTYNQQTDKIRYTMTIKNIGNVGYNFVQGTPWAGLMSNIYPENFGLMENLSALGGNNDHLNMDTITPILGSVVGTNTKCNTFKVGISYSLNGDSLLPGDTNIANNTVEKCTTFTKTSSNTQQSTGSTTSPSTNDKEDLTITNASANGAYPKSTLTLTLANLGKADYDIGSNDPTVKLFCYQQGFKKFGVSKLITDYIGSSQPSISTTLDLKLRGGKKSVKDIICTIDSNNVLKESDEINNTYVFRI